MQAQKKQSFFLTKSPSERKYTSSLLDERLEIEKLVPVRCVAIREKYTTSKEMATELNEICFLY